MKEKIETLIKETDKFEKKILAGGGGYLELLPNYIKDITTVITEIIASYTTPELQKYSEDAVYWSDLCRRIMNALNFKDDFCILDLIHFELKSSLNMYLEILEQV